MWNLTQPAFIDSDLPPAFELVDFSAGAVKSFTKYCQNVYDKGIPFATLKIQSYGGDIGALSGFMSIMDHYRKKGVVFCGVVSGVAFSAGAAVFLYCDQDYRYMGQFATLMVHNTQVSYPPDRVSAMKNFSTFIHNQDEEVNQKLSIHLKKGKNWLSNEIKKRNNEDWWITATEAEQLKLSKTGLPNFNAEVSVQFSITF